ncbi:MAG: S9 family peptidase [Candidatus Marinimicrobia bacterium]|nr:S9 family peptidase [Candidatus Neomarinimicrobiota bacterium]
MAFLSNRTDEKDKPGTRIWAMPLSGGEAKPLTAPEREILDFKWSTDGSFIYYLSPEIVSEQTRTWIKQREKSGFDAIDRTAQKPKIELWVVDKSECKPKRLFVGDPGITSFDIDSPGELLVYSTNYTGDDNDWVETDLFLFSIYDSSELRQLTAFKGSEGTPVFSPNDQFIAYERPQDYRKPFSQNEVEIISVTGDPVKRITKDLDLNIGGFKWYSDHALLLEVNQGMTNQLYVAALDGQIIEISGGAAYFFRSAVSPGSPALVALRQTAVSLGEILFSEGPGHPWVSLSHQSEALEKLQLHPQTTYQWLSRDERFNLQGLVVLPHFSGNESLPLIVDIHGGPAGRTDIALEQFAMYQAWASQGFAVFSPNYRGSEGYSAAFQTANYRDLGGGDYHDIISGVKDLIRRGIAHPDSLVIMGGSYGGYMTNWIITQTNLFKVAVSRYGIFDLKSDFSNSIYAQWELDYLGKPYWESPNLYRRMSPSTFIKKAKTPTLILHGADDENTFTSNSRELARALKTLEVPHRFFLYPREGHGMDEPNHRLDVFQRQLSWVNQHLGRKAALTGEDWLSKDIRIQILRVNNKARFLNRPNEAFLSIKLLVDGSRLTADRQLNLIDFRIDPGKTLPVGLPSGQILLQDQDFNIQLGPDAPTLELELIFPRSQASKLKLTIRDLGSYAITQ